MALANNIRREVEIRIKTYEERYFDAATGMKIEEPKWKLISDEANYDGLGIVEAIEFLLKYLPKEL